MSSREKFSGKLGFVLSCIGAAVGLGNIWMFPYRIGEYGGAAFLIPYLFFVFIFGTTGFLTEVSFGRALGTGSFSGIRQIFKDKNLKGYKILSLIPTLALFGILVFYNVVVGWILKYFYLSLNGDILKLNPTEAFQNFVATKETIFWNGLAIILTLSIVIFGISKGIEKLNKIIMPALFIIFFLLTINSLSLPGASKGISYLFNPRWEYLLNVKTWVMALGQAFFTISLTGCGLVVYGSYLNKDINLISSTINTAIFTTLSAILASLVIIPAVFAFDLDIAAGPSLLFITVPAMFKSMPFGGLISIIFFLSIIFAAISSSVVMLEGPVEAVISHFNWSRKKSTIVVALVGFVLSIPLNLSMDVFSNFSDFITIFLAPLGILIVSIVFYWIYGYDKALNEIKLGSKRPLGKYYYYLSKYLFPIVTFTVIILGVVYGGIG